MFSGLMTGSECEASDELKECFLRDIEGNVEAWLNLHLLNNTDTNPSQSRSLA